MFKHEECPLVRPFPRIVLALALTLAAPAALGQPADPPAEAPPQAEATAAPAPVPAAPSAKAEDDDSLTGQSVAQFFSDVGYLVFMGDTPGPSFSYGSWPYAPQPSAGARKQHAFLRARLGATGLADEAGRGFEAFVKAETTWSPGLYYWHQSVQKHASGDRLSVDTFGIEPRLYTSSLVRVYWSLGGAFHSDAAGIRDAGLQMGAAVDVFPIRPLALEGRVNGHFMKDDSALDLYLGVGVEAWRWFYVQTGYRLLLTGDVFMNLFTVGVSVNLGL